MKIRFKIQYSTQWGEILHVVATYKTKGGNSRSHNVQMKTSDGISWYAEASVVNSSTDPVITFSYHYQVEDVNGKVKRQECNKISRTYPYDGSKDYLLSDEWSDVPLQNHLYSKAYEYIVKRTEEKIKNENVRPLPYYHKTIILRVSAPQLRAHEALGVCGSEPSLGNWDVARYLRMEYIGGHEWMTSVDASCMKLPVEYKYVIVDKRTQDFKYWEDGENRHVDANDIVCGNEQASSFSLTENASQYINKDYSTYHISEIREGQVLVKHGGVLHIKESTWRVAGVMVPLFSLRSEKSFGIGDFGDLMRFIDWAGSVGLKIIQLLPINDCQTLSNENDHNPYISISAFALNPLFLDLGQLESTPSSEDIKIFNRQQRELNNLSHIDYKLVSFIKKRYVDKVYEQQGEKTINSKEYSAFIKNNFNWLMPYATYCALRSHYNTDEHNKWEDYSLYSQETIEKAINPSCFLYDKIRRICYIQFHLHCQLERVSQYARSKGITLMTNVSIGVGRNSVETWTHPTLFNINTTMGAMPKDKELFGERWNVPSWNWEKQLGVITWWRERLRHIEQYFDAIRLDNVISMFRSWDIPNTQLSTMLGHFSTSLPYSIEEIEASGLSFTANTLTKPYIDDEIIDSVFNIHSQQVKNKYLTPISDNQYELKDSVNTQSKIHQYFIKSKDEDSLWICNGLCSLCENVLFVEDGIQKNMYHPKFMKDALLPYRILNSDERSAYSKLYYDYFYNRHHDYWRNMGEHRLSAIIQDSQMLICCDNRGTAPKGMTEALDSLQILTLEIQRCPKTANTVYDHLSANTYRSVASTSNYDMSPLRLWWQENDGMTQLYYASIMQKEGKAPRILSAQLAEEIVAQHLYSSSMLCILPLQDWMAIDASMQSSDIESERIASPNHACHQWKYRMYITIEQLMKEQQFNSKIQTLISRSHR